MLTLGFYITCLKINQKYNILLLYPAPAAGANYIMKAKTYKLAAVVLFCLLAAQGYAQNVNHVKYEKIELAGQVPITLELAYVPGVVKQYAAILMIGTLKPDGKNIKLPDWSTALVKEGYMLAAFEAHRPPGP